MIASGVTLFGMSTILLATLLAMSSVQIRNPAECSTLPVDQQRICTQEIRAGRAYDAQGFDSFQAPVASQPASQPLGPSLEERKTVAAERTASATETIATVGVISLSLSIIVGIIIFVMSL